MLFQKVLTGQIRTPDIAHKKEITRQQSKNVRRASVIRDGKGDRIRGMAGGLNNFEFGCAKPEALSLADFLVRVGRVNSAMDVDRCAGACREFGAARNMVRVQMRIKNGLNLKPVLLGRIEILPDVSFRVNDARGSLCRAANQV